MKKFIALFLLLCFYCPVFAEVMPPRWSEFCAHGYVEAGYKEHIKRNPLVKPIAFVGQVCTLNIIPLYWNIIKRDNEVNTNNYWVDRRHQFEDEIKTCNEYENKDNKLSCYMNIRQLEHNKNVDYNNNIIAQENLRMQRLQYMQQVQTNSNLRNINNNLNNTNRYLRYGY